MAARWRILVLFVAVVVPLLMPAGAAAVTYPSAAAVDRWIVGNGITTHLVAKRDGYGATVTLTITDNRNDGKCVFAIVDLLVDQGSDPNHRTENCRGNGQSVPESYRLGGPTSSGRSVGSAITGVKFHQCIKISWAADSCTPNTTYTLAQHARLAAQDRIDLMDGYMKRDIVAGPGQSSFMTIWYWANGRPNSSYQGFTWTTDGCSVPSSWAWNWLTDTWKQRFWYACVRHDWAYRNFGASLYNDLTDARRLAADQRFREDMNKLCSLNSWTGCTTVAETFYQSVRLGGTKTFFGR